VGSGVIVGNENSGQWKQRSTFDNPKVMARILGDDLFNYARPRAEASYAVAAHQITIDPGEDLFRRRCQVCHTMGAGDTVGPDLVGVTSNRKRAWLTRWIQAPDEVLAAKDPIATALYAKYKEVTMPNLHLTDTETANLIGYLEAETKRLAIPTPSGHDHEHMHDHMHMHAASSAGTTGE
jgi:protein SCO1/2